MTDWSFQGALPPRGDDEWQAEFRRYQQFPEFQRQNMHITLDEFKYIYMVEWSHRMLGRAIGLAFTAPLAYFAVRRAIPRTLHRRMALMLALGGSQGLIGWWMVKSGLTQPQDPRREVRVSPYRLTAHLTMAFTLYSMLLWTAMDLIRPQPAVPAAFSAPAARELLSRVLRLRGSVHSVAALLAVTVLSGAFVAGNGAGFAYNDFPFFAGKWLPDDMWDETLAPAWRNWFETTGLVQLDHRALAFSTLFAIAWAFRTARNPRELWAALPRSTQRAMHAFMGMAGLQVTLGISTLMLYVPPWLGTAHQGGALALWSFALYAMHSLRFARTPAFRAMLQQARQAAVKAA
jgi:cytochrome c oxidase assembly protein subunit 15